MTVKRVLQIFRNGRPDNLPLEIPLLDGEQGNRQTLQHMAQIVKEDRTRKDLRNFVLDRIVDGVPEHDELGEINAIFEFAKRAITYRKDPYKTERIADMWSTLYALNDEQPEGDCGIISVFMATCFALLGYAPYFVVIAQTPDAISFNHVYNAIMYRGELKYFDGTPEDAPPGWETKHFRKMVVPIF